MNNKELKNLLYANCSKYVGAYANGNNKLLTSDELNKIQKRIISLICEMCHTLDGVKYKGTIDINKDFKKIDTDYTKEHKDDIFYILWICNEFADDNVEMRNIMFHPNGKTGCITVDDSYIFDIRCDHLVWIEGYSEVFGNGYLVIGNHKGLTAINFVSSIGEVVGEDVCFLFE